MTERISRASTVILTSEMSQDSYSQRSLFRNDRGMELSSSRAILLAMQQTSALDAPTAQLLTIERVGILKRVGILNTVPGHALVPVARVLEEVPVRAGATVIERGALEDWLFVIAHGRVRVHVGERTLVELGPGSVVGELAVLAPAPRSASVTAMEPTLMLRLRRRPFEELLEDHPEIARSVITALAARLQDLADADADAESQEDARGADL